MMHIRGTTAFRHRWQGDVSDERSHAFRACAQAPHRKGLGGPLGLHLPCLLNSVLTEAWLYASSAGKRA